MYHLQRQQTWRPCGFTVWNQRIMWTPSFKCPSDYLNTSFAAAILAGLQRCSKTQQHTIPKLLLHPAHAQQMSCPLVQMTVHFHFHACSFIIWRKHWSQSFFFRFLSIPLMILCESKQSFSCSSVTMLLTLTCCLSFNQSVFLLYHTVLWSSLQVVTLTQ